MPGSALCLANTVVSPERWRFGVGVRGCAIPDEKISRRAIKAKPRTQFAAARKTATPDVIGTTATNAASR